jgi:hypothetical protein
MWEIFYFLDDALYWIAGERYAIAAGDCVILEPGDVHGALPVPHPVDIVVVQFPRVLGDKIYLTLDEAISQGHPGGFTPPNENPPNENQPNGKER